jgi:thymidylate synthase (FAD)
MIELIDHLGTDLTVVNAARVSMDKVSDVLDDRDIKLIQYLAKYNHWTPFSQPQIQLRIKMPIFVARQWFKSTAGLTRNEVSRRYVDTDPEFFVPELWRNRPDGSIKQGSGSILGDSDQVDVSKVYREFLAGAIDVYRGLVKRGIAPEQARMILPQSMMTEFIETGSLAAYARMFKLRIDGHAQKEIQEYAGMLDGVVSELFPVSWAALIK